MARKPKNTADFDDDDDGLSSTSQSHEEATAREQGETFPAGAVPDPDPPHSGDQVAEGKAVEVTGSLVLRDPLTTAEADAAAKGDQPVIVDTGAGHAPTAAQGQDEGFVPADGQSPGLSGVGNTTREPVTAAAAEGRIVPPSQPLPPDPEVEAARQVPAGKAPIKRDAANDLQNLDPLEPGVNIPAGPGEAQPRMTESQRFPARPPRATLGTPHMVNGFPAYDVPESERRGRAVTWPPPTEDAPVHLGITGDGKANRPIDGAAGKPLHELNQEAWATDEKHAEQMLEATAAANKVAEPLLKGVPRRRAAMRRMQKDLTALPPEVAGQAAKRSNSKRK